MNNTRSNHQLCFNPEIVVIFGSSPRSRFDNSVGVLLPVLHSYSLPFPGHQYLDVART